MSSGTHAPRGERPGPAVRPRAEGDLGDCVRVLAEVHRHDGYPVNWPGRPAEWLARAGMLGAWVGTAPDGRVVGHVGLSRSGDGDLAPALWGERNGTGAEGAAVVSRLFVDPWTRGRGIGALLLGRAVREAGRLGLHPVLEVVASDTAAAALYERLGWEFLATREQRWGSRQTVTVHCYAGPTGPTGPTGPVGASAQDEVV
nr:GNAT family N-acetyltransferase [Streptomyces sp. CRN 30]